MALWAVRGWVPSRDGVPTESCTWPQPSLPLWHINVRNRNKKESVGVLKQAFWPREGDRRAAAKPGWPPAPRGGLLPAELASSPLTWSLLANPPCHPLLSPFQALRGGFAELWAAGLIYSPKEKVACEVPAVSLLGSGTKARGPGALHSWSLTAWSHCRPCFLAGSSASIKAQPKMEGGPWSVAPKSSWWISVVLAHSTSVHQELVPRRVSCPWKQVCPCAGWSLNFRFQLYGPYCVSYCWCSVLPVSVDAGPKITLRLAGLVGSRCAGSTAHLAVEKGDVLALLSLERVSSS